MKPLLLNLFIPLSSCLVNLSLPLPPLLFPSPWLSFLDPDPSYHLAISLLTNLSLPEKINLTTGTGWQTTRCIGSTGSIPRLQFPSLCLMDGPLGIRYVDNASAFPAGLNVAATFSRRLLRLRGIALGSEFKGKGIDIMLGPASGPLGRSPKGGRNWEGFGSDPYLAGERGVIAIAKHFVLNEQEHLRGSVDVRIGDREMHEVYLWPFQDAVKAGVGGVMCSYNKINGSFSCENEWTGGYLLKGELGFKGFVMSDWGAQHTGLGSAVAGGLDMTMPGGGLGEVLWGGGEMIKMVLREEVPGWRVDDMVLRVLRSWFKVVGEKRRVNFSAWTNETFGAELFAANRSWGVVNEHVDVQGDHGELIREIGAKSTVLLKNNGMLPLSEKAGSIAVIGNDAQDWNPNSCPERACMPRPGTIAMGYGSGTAEFPYLISPATALLLRCQQDNISFFNTTSNWDLLTARKIASLAEIAIVFAAAQAGENFVSIDNNFGDRNNLTLWDNADALITSVASVNPNTIVVLHTPGPVLLSAHATNPNISAILWAGFPGQETGNSITDILFGDVNPQGRTPFTWAFNESDYGPVDIVTSVPDPKNPTQYFQEGILIDYRYFDSYNITPLYEFGFGLSYTSFNYSNLTITKLVPSINSFPAPPPQKETGPAPTFGHPYSKNLTDYLPPPGFEQWEIKPFIYPYLTNSSINSSWPLSPTNNSLFPAAAYNSSSQPVLPAGGAEGGNPDLWTPVFNISFSLTNTGNRNGTEIPQLYVQLGGPPTENAPQVLRGFDEIELNVGETKQVLLQLTRRDISNWNTEEQNWEVIKGEGIEKKVFVGASSRDLRLEGVLDVC
ncbi:family 3 putative glycoside hydrolase [Podospora fimiseda]|uniref:beta-glucosidase n=1 Tax=Podospora fimiseda TaxID=252190 RepID=A0AAN7H871_9PEZI|nr:family 3 putative glycoside hydrolase [Podospora fimiseda]